MECPHCHRELKEDDVIKGICPHCHKIFNLPQQISAQQKSGWSGEKKIVSNPSSNSVNLKYLLSKEAIITLGFVFLSVLVLSGLILIGKKQDSKVVDIKKIYNELRKKCPPKGEFETTEEYKNRVFSFSNDAPTYLSPVLNFPPSFILKYNPDSSSLHISFVFTFREISAYKVPFLNHSMSSEHFMLIRITDESVKKDTYIGINAFGGMREVKRYKSIEYALFPLNSEEIFEKINYLSDIKIPMNREEAELFLKNEGKIAMWILWKPSAVTTSGKVVPLTFRTYSHVEPTFDFPTEFSCSTFCISARVLRIFLYNPDVKKRIDIYP